MQLRMAYLHGFASSPDSLKGRRLATDLEARGVALERPDLAMPDFGRLTITAALEALDAMHRSAGSDARWGLIGSSLGGYLAALWAERHPERVARLVLLCPAFNMNEWWPRVVGADGMARWRAHGRLAMPDARGVLTPVHWGFIEDAMTYPAFPEVPCPTLILHGTRDETIPVETSTRYAESRVRVRVRTLDDDHALAASLDAISEAVVAELGLGAPPPGAPGPADRPAR
jgi:pimeloyl-ACP methyl ester carboxylesterase